MPLFGSKHNTTTTQPAPAPISTHTTNNTHRSSGFFSSHRRSTSTSPTATTRTHTTHGSKSSGGIFSRKEDPSISAARQRVATAEQAEREADRALVQARTAVRDARAHVQALEREAAEEARAAQIKQGQAKDLGKRARGMGRFGGI